MREINDDDKLWAALSWAIPIVAIVVLFIEGKRSRPFIKYHAVNSIVFSVALSIFATCTLGCGGILGLVIFYWAYLAYQGQWVEVPWVTDFSKNQGWIA